MTDSLALMLLAAPRLLTGLSATVLLAGTSLLFGLLLGLAFGLIRAARLRVAGALVAAYVHLVRGTPFVVQLYVAYFVLPRLGWRWLELDAWTAAVAALSLYAGAYATEIVRGAVDAVPSSQAEAATALGLVWWQSALLVIMPQALRAALPSLAGLAAVVMKTTSVASVVGISELLRAGQNLALSQPRHLMLMQGMVALIYLATCLPLFRLASWLERRQITDRLDRPATIARSQTAPLMPPTTDRAVLPKVIL